MAQTYQCVLLGDGGRVPRPAGTAVAAGEVVITNGMFQFATSDIPASTAGTLITAGGPPMVRIVKVNGAISVGNAVYWAATGNPQGGVAGTGAATTTAGSNTLFARCVVAAGATDEYVDCELTIGVITAGTLENAITDPGNGGAIPVTRSGYVALVSTGAQTRTLAAPAAIGLMLMLYCKTFVGNIVITSSTTVNEAGNNTITYTATGQSVLLHSVEEGATLRWRVTIADGAALSTV